MRTEEEKLYREIIILQTILRSFAVKERNETMNGYRERDAISFIDL